MDNALKVARSLGKVAAVIRLLRNKDHATQLLDETFCVSSSNRRNESEVVLENARTIEQSALHRCIHLIDAGIGQIADQNPYALALITRGHMESVAQLGYFCHQVSAFLSQSISIGDLREKLYAGLMGFAHKEMPDSPKPIQVMKCMDKADVFFARLTESKEVGGLRDDYELVSNYCHPNFLSFQLMMPGAIDQDYSSSKGRVLTKQNSYLISSLSISTDRQRLFSERFVDLRKQLQNKLAQGNC